MAAFDDVTLTWQGVDYVIPANRMMGAIARIEDHVTMPELQRFGERASVPLSRLAAAYASVLRYAGAKVTDEDIYEAMFDTNDATTISQSISVIMAMMVPRKAREAAMQIAKKASEPTGGDTEREAKAAGNSVPAATASSPKPTSSRSVKGGSRLRNSGRSRPKNSIG